MLQVNIRPHDDGNSSIGSFYGFSHRSIVDPEIVMSNENIYESMVPSVADSDYLISPGCIYLSQSNSVAIFKQPPSYRWVSYKPFEQDSIEDRNDNGVDTPIYRYRIPIPSTLYLIILDSYTYHLQEMYAFCYTSNTLEQSTELFLLPLNNYYIDGKLCMSRNDYLDRQNPHLYFSYLINAVWQENFNYDTTGVMNEYSSNADKYFGSHPLFDVAKFRENMHRDHTNKFIYEFLESISMSDAINLVRWLPVTWGDSIDPGLTYRYIERYAMNVQSNSFDATSLINSIRKTMAAQHTTTV